MTPETREGASGRAGAVRGALLAAAGALLMILLAAAWTPTRLPSLVGPDPMPRVLAFLSLFAAAIAGGVVGRRVAGLRASKARRRAIVLGWTFAVYYASVTVPVVALAVADQGAALFAEPFQLVVRGLVVCLLLFPWAALPIASTALAMERWTRPGGA